MAEKLLKETKDTQTKRKKTKKVAEEDDIYKMDLTLESPENEDDFKAKDLESEEKEEKTSSYICKKTKINNKQKQCLCKHFALCTERHWFWLQRC